MRSGCLVTWGVNKLHLTINGKTTVCGRSLEGKVLSHETPLRRYHRTACDHCLGKDYAEYYDRNVGTWRGIREMWRGWLNRFGWWNGVYPIPYNNYFDILTQELQCIE
jgi:hypothetical protein